MPLPQSDECCVCYLATKTRTPCKHPLCGDCSRQLRDPKCPLCRYELSTAWRNRTECAWLLRRCVQHTGRELPRFTAAVLREPRSRSIASGTSSSSSLQVPDQLTPWRRPERASLKPERAMLPQCSVCALRTSCCTPCSHPLCGDCRRQLQQPRCPVCRWELMDDGCQMQDWRVGSDGSPETKWQTHVQERRPMRSRSVGVVGNDVVSDRRARPCRSHFKTENASATSLLDAYTQTVATLPRYARSIVTTIFREAEKGTTLAGALTAAQELIHLAGQDEASDKNRSAFLVSRAWLSTAVAERLGNASFHEIGSDAKRLADLLQNEQLAAGSVLRGVDMAVQRVAELVPGPKVKPTLALVERLVCCLLRLREPEYEPFLCIVDEVAISVAQHLAAAAEAIPLTELAQELPRLSSLLEQWSLAHREASPLLRDTLRRRLCTQASVWVAQPEELRLTVPFTVWLEILWSSAVTVPRTLDRDAMSELVAILGASFLQVGVRTENTLGPTDRIGLRTPDSLFREFTSELVDELIEQPDTIRYASCCRVLLFGCPASQDLAAFEVFPVSSDDAPNDINWRIFKAFADAKLSRPYPSPKRRKGAAPTKFRSGARVACQR